VSRPIACDRAALDAAERIRQQALLEWVRLNHRERQQSGERTTLRFARSPAVFQELAAWIALERRCCPFLSFTLGWDADDVIRVTLDGPSGTAAFVASLLHS
jgi:hypothetical protein